ncbi:NrfD/PsrC family molybdoenzyme membrane anchor subunit, partial [uncultured Campylobacter sp.]
MTMVQTTWGWLIVIYLFLGGLGAGAFLCSALAYKGFLGSLNERFY